MKSILLATASILAFAGAAAAEVRFGGDAEVGYNLDDEDEIDDGYDGEQGFFWEANLGVTLEQELNNGLTAGASLTLNLTGDDEDGNPGDDGDISSDDDFLLYLTGETGGIFLGDTEFAAESHWNPAGEMLADDFSEADGETALKGNVTYGGIEGSVSYVLADDENDRPDEDGLDQLSLGAEVTVGRFGLTMGYQEESEAIDAGGVGYDPRFELDADGDVVDLNDDFSYDEVFGISAGTTFGGADIRVGYATNLTEEDDSLGFEVAYPFGPVTLGAYYVLENDDASDIVGDDGDEDLDNTFGVSADYASGPIAVRAFYEFEDDQEDEGTIGEDDEIGEDDDFGVEGSYQAGNGLEIFAGYIDSTEGYVGAEYDLGNGAELILSYAEQDEEGEPEYEEGTTVALSLEF